ncbi:phosphatase PAP2 family protein [Myroides sp. LJL119]
MLETIIKLDKELLIFFNNLGSTSFDSFWLFITKQLNWIPFFLVLLYAVFKKVSLKTLGVILLLLALLITVTDQFTNLVKWSSQRARPCNTDDIKHLLRIIRCSDSLSFFSGHASNSTATMTFLFLILRKYYKYAFLVFVFPLIFAYSRIYLALHFPGDILVGVLVGVCFGLIWYQLYLYIEKKYLMHD